MAEWTHFDLEVEYPTYTVPPMNRKLKKAAKENPATPPHVVPLSRQALGILSELRQLTGHGRYLFPGARDPKRHMSDGAVNAALALIGYKDIITRHGFRHMARTLLGKLGWNPEALERQLSHKEPGIVGVYNKAQHLPERRKVMQAWADYLDSLKASGDVASVTHASAMGRGLMFKPPLEHSRAATGYKVRSPGHDTLHARNACAAGELQAQGGRAKSRIPIRPR